MIKKFDIVSVVTNKRQEGEGLATVLGLTTFDGEEAAIIQYHFNSCPAQQVCTRFMKVHKQNRIDELEAALKNLLNDYINFDDGHLTEVFQVEASKLLDPNRPVE
jgi:hypothetical protein